MALASIVSPPFHKPQPQMAHIQVIQHHMTDIIAISDASIRQARDILAAGGLVAFPQKLSMDLAQMHVTGGCGPHLPSQRPTKF